MEIGQICVKLAGRDAGKKCVIVDILDSHFVLIDGSTRRRKCNMLHLEPLKETIELKKGASHAEVKKAFAKLNIPVWETKAKEKTHRPRRLRKKPVKEAKPEPKAKKASKPAKTDAKAEPKVKAAVK